MKRYIYLVICLFVCLLIFKTDVNALCFEIKNLSTGDVRYDFEYDTRLKNDSNYSINTVDNEKCGLKSTSTSTSNSSSSNNKVKCGKIGKFHKKIPELTSWMITIIQVAVPVILVIFGSIDFIKAMTSQREDEIKKGQQLFVKRIITAGLTFFVVAIVKLFVGIVSSGSVENNNIVSCINCFISNKCDKV